ncbi:MAG: thermonuclease family protein [Deltaproteobacteria bacterium]|nr:thermonuclease family protein [Deltaproteobacteria bacterium]
MRSTITKKSDLARHLLSIAILATFLSSCAAHTLTVKKVIDGDTVTLSDGRKVRLIGVDTPESRPNGKAIHDSKKGMVKLKTILFLGSRASAFTKQKALHQAVKVEYDHERKDKYGRTLAYLRFSDGSLLNETIIREGFGCAYRKFDFIYKERFISVESEARAQKRGLWPKLSCP